MSSVLAPPYDVIYSEGREALAKQDEKNCVRIILPTSEEEGDAKYEVAANLIHQWQAEGTLVRDEAPAIYRYHQVFRHSELGEQQVVRRGFIAAVRLHEFDEGVILRHERTLKGPKVDRLKLWDSTRCHLSQIFTLYSDPKSDVDAMFADIESELPLIDGTTEDGTRHLLWRVSDADTIAKVSAYMEGKPLYIADGHHRYETMLALRNKLLADTPEASARSSARFGMMFLANMDDPGLVVLPTHRLIHGVENFDANALRVRLEEFFLVQELSIPEDSDAAATVVRNALAEAASQGTSFGLLIPGEKQGAILTVKPGLDLAAAGLTGSKETLALDVTLLHDLVLDKILGIDRAAQAAQSNIKYLRDTRSAMERCASGEGQACFFMNATPVSQVVAVSDAGEVMPQKSTFFYPKIASGMVFNPIDIDEEL